MGKEILLSFFIVLGHASYGGSGKGEITADYYIKRETLTVSYGGKAAEASHEFLVKNGRKESIDCDGARTEQFYVPTLGCVKDGSTYSCGYRIESNGDASYVKLECIGQPSAGGGN